MQRIRQGAFALVLLAASALAAAQPVHPVRMMVGFPPGGAVDILARVFAEKISEGIGRPVIVEARPGAAGRAHARDPRAHAGPRS